jgi:hypothetical protein
VSDETQTHLPDRNHHLGAQEHLRRFLACAQRLSEMRPSWLLAWFHASPANIRESEKKLHLMNASIGKSDKANKTICYLSWFKRNRWWCLSKLLEQLIHQADIILFRRTFVGVLGTT